MAYVQVTGVERVSAQAFRVLYEVRADDARTLEVKASITLRYLPKSEGTAAQRRTRYRDQLTAAWDAALLAAEAGHDEFDAISAALTGLRYPAA